MKENKYNMQKMSQKGHFTQKEASPMGHDDQVEGRNSVIELLEAGRDINKIFVQTGEKHGSINKIIARIVLSIIFTKAIDGPT